MDDVERKGWDRFLGRLVVIDTSTSLIYLGTLREADDHFLVLETADVHDRGEGHSTNERYALESRMAGIRANRRSVTVRKAVVLSVSLLEDVIPY
jgi:small nuclear ribonucleoprotein (snRNP)-like protein